MRAIVKNSLLVFIATGVLGGAAAYGQGTAQQRGGVNDSASTSVSSAKLSLGIGDKLKIAFYETIDVAAMKQADPQGVGQRREREDDQPNRRRQQQPERQPVGFALSS